MPESNLSPASRRSIQVPDPYLVSLAAVLKLVNGKRHLAALAISAVAQAKRRASHA